MGKKDMFKYGSRWIRTDFHLHTRSDHTFKYTGEDDRFVADYVDALRRENIGVGMITNHNQFDRGEFMALQKRARRQDIMLLAGVELRINEGANGIHTLVVFSEEWLDGGEDYINQFLSVAFQGKALSERRDCLTTIGLLDTINKLENFDKDFFLVFAHVEDESGFWRELEGGRISDFGRDEDFQSRALGFQKVRTHDKGGAGKPDREKVKHWLEGWYPAEVEGSDPKSMEEVGKCRPCYLKIGDWSFNAVKYALIDHHARVAETPVKPTHSYIKEIKFQGGILDGQEISLSPALNTLIGIRGSGKSSIIEAIRYAFNIALGDMVKDDDPYKEQLPAFVLGSGGKVTIKAIDRHGQEYEVRRIYGDSPDVFIDGHVHPGISLRETVLRNPIYFGQKDLSNTDAEFEKGLVDRILSDKLGPIRAQIESQNQIIAEMVTRLKNMANLEDKLEEYKARKANAEHRLEQYSTYGLEERLQKQIEYDSDARKCGEVIATARDYLADLESLLVRHEDALKNHLHHKSNINETFFKDFFETYGEIISTTGFLQEQMERIRATVGKLERQKGAFEQERAGLKDEFAEIERKIAEELKDTTGLRSIDTGEFRNLRVTIDQSKAMIQALQQEQQEKQQLKTRLLQELATLKDLWHQEFLLLQNELDKVNKPESPIKIVVEFKGDQESFLEFFKGNFRGSRIREDAFKSLLDKYADFIEMYKDLENLTNSLSPGYRDTFGRFFSDYLEDLLIYQVPNRFEILYRGLPIREHSLGQRASALILFILSQQDNDVIIIDQPEDDLDNQTIYEDVVKLILRLKSETQFIFATHNANFPVLGDAEQVITCKYDSDGIKPSTGSIDKPKTQQDIVSIMEGGEEAFKKRGRKYKAWKPRNF